MFLITTTHQPLKNILLSVCIRLYWSREGKSSNSINTKIERRSSNTMFPNFLIPKMRQLTMRDVIHISDRNTAPSSPRFVQLS